MFAFRNKSCVLPKTPGALSECVTSYNWVGLPVLAVLDALSQRGSLVERRVSTTASTSGQDAILKDQGGKKTRFSNVNAAESESEQTLLLLKLTVEGVALFFRSAETAGLAGTLVVELPDEPFLPESSAAVLLSA